MAKSASDSAGQAPRPSLGKRLFSPEKLQSIQDSIDQEVERLAGEQFGWPNQTPIILPEHIRQALRKATASVQQRSFHESGGINGIAEDPAPVETGVQPWQQWQQALELEAIRRLQAESLSTDDIKKMSMDDFAKVREKLLGIAKDESEGTPTPWAVKSGEVLDERTASLTCVWCGLVCEDETDLEGHEGDCR